MSLGLVRLASASSIHKFCFGAGKFPCPDSFAIPFYEWICSIFGIASDRFLMGEFHLSDW